MKSKLKILSLIVLMSLLTTTFAVLPVFSQSGPRADDQVLHMYLNPDAMFAAFEAGENDFPGWPLTKDWVDRWSPGGTNPDPNIRMVGYSEMAWNELTPNHQLWPTGWRDYNTNPTMTLGGELEQYDESRQRDRDAKKFRQAIAYLNDKDRYIADVLKGYGFRTEASIAYPAFARWVNPDLLVPPPEGQRRDYNQAEAIALLEAGGFRDYDGDTIREWDEDRDGVGYEELPPLEFWSRLDDPNRGDSGDILYAELTGVGIPVNYHKELGWPCYLHAMFGAAAGEALPANWPDVSHWMPGGEWMEGIKRCHLYTSGWIATSPTQDQFFDLYTHTMATEADGEFSLNYGGFYMGDGVEGTADDAYDFELAAQKAKFGQTESAAKAGIFLAQELANELVCVVPWFSLMSVRAYRHNEGPDEVFQWEYEPGTDDSGWFGAVNHVTLGTDFSASNQFSFLNAYNPADTVLDYAQHQEPFTLNFITAQWLYESNILNQMYEPLWLHTPWDVISDYPWLGAAMEYAFTLASAASAGDLTIDLNEETGPLPDEGYVTINPGGGNEETVEFEAKGITSLDLTDPLGNAHAAGEGVIFGAGADGVFGTPSEPAGYFDDVKAVAQIWSDPDGIPDTGDEKQKWTVRLRDDATFHNGDPVTTEDLQFAYLFSRDCGPGTCFGYPTFAFIDYVNTIAEEPTLGNPYDVAVYYNVASYWAIYWVTYVGPINKDIWMAANDAYNWGYKWPRGETLITGYSAPPPEAPPEKNWVLITWDHMGCQILPSNEVYYEYAPGEFFGPKHVQQKIPLGGGFFEIWLETIEGETPEGPEPAPLVGGRLADKVCDPIRDWDTVAVHAYQPWLMDADDSGLVDLMEDPTGPWKFVTWAPGEYVSMEANTDYYKTQAEISLFLGEAFHRGGNVNYPGSIHEAEYPFGVDMEIRVEDGMQVARGFGRTPAYTPGVGWYLWNCDTDFDRDDWTWGFDLWSYGAHYGSDAG